MTKTLILRITSQVGARITVSYSNTNFKDIIIHALLEVLYIHYSVLRNTTCASLVKVVYNTPSGSKD